MVRSGRAIRSVLLALAFVLVTPSPALASEDVELTFFWGDGCRYCAAEHEFLDALSAEFPRLVIIDYEVWRRPENVPVFREMAARFGVEASAVPTTFFGDRVWVGFDDRIGSDIRAAVIAALGDDPTGDPEPSSTVWLPIFGDVDVGSASLVMATIVIGLVDGFNPCSLWALSILLALVVRGGSRTRLVAVAGTFLLVTTVIYGAFVMGTYGALSVVAHVGWVRVAVAAVALAFGIVNVKDYVAFRVGPSLTISDSQKPTLYARMRRVVSEDRRLPMLIAGSAGLAAGVAILELPCTAGMPVLWSNLMSASGVDGGAAFGLLGLYLSMYLLDEIVVVGVVVVAMRATKLQESHGRTLKLISGWLMITLAGTLIFQPRAMESFGGIVLVVGLTVVLAGVTAVVDELRRERLAAKERETALRGRTRARRRH
jgi:thiol-disulfide isomerase/thioredoxin